MNKILIALGLALLIAGVCLVTPSSAFQDNFQYQNDAAEFAEKWSKFGTAGGGYCVDISQGLNYEVQSNFPSGYTYSKAFHLATCGNAFYGGYVWIKSTKFSTSTNYVSLNVLRLSSGYGSGGDVPQLFIKLFNDADVEVALFNVLSYTQGTGLWELVRHPETNVLYFFLNGVNVVGGGGGVDTCAEPFSYIQFYLNTPSNAPSGYSYADMYIDDISTTGYVDGIGSFQYIHKLTEDDPTEIDYSWTMKHYPDVTFDDHEYKVQIRNSYGNILSSETLTGSDRDHGIRKYDSSTLFSNDYDWYYFFITKDGVERDSEHIEYLHPYSPGCEIAFDDDIYYKGEVANISYTIFDPVHETNDYYVRVNYISGVKTLMESWKITSGTTGYVEWDSTDVNEGYYLAELSIIEPGEDEGLLAADLGVVASGILITGYTYKADSCEILGSVNVNFSQSGVWDNITSDAVTGYYELKGFNVNQEISVYASKAAYTHADFTFTPPVEVFYEIDLYLIPNTESSDLYGLVTSYPLHQGINASTVVLSNATWGDTDMTNPCGFYEFDGVVAGAYNVSASAGGYIGSANESLTLPIRHDILLHPSITLKVRAKDVASGSFLSIFQVSVNGGVLEDSVAGTVTFDAMDWGYYELRCVANEYYVSYDYVFLVENKTITINMILMPTQGGMGVQYIAKHEVKFIVQDKFGSKYEDVAVTAVVIENSGPLEWLLSILGYSNETYIDETTLEGTTGTDGVITFHMVETLKYKVTFKNIAEGIDEVLNIYPKNDKYIVYISSDLFGGSSDWLGEQPSMVGNEIIINFSTNKISEAKCYLNIVYNDNTENTNSLYLYVKTANGTILSSKNKNLDYYEYSYLASNISGNTFIYGIQVDHATYGTLEEAKVVHFAKRTFIIDGWTDSYYNWSSFAICFTIAALFTGVKVKYGAVIFPIFCWLFWYIGWFTLGTIILGIITTLGVLFYITAKGREAQIS